MKMRHETAPYFIVFTILAFPYSLLRALITITTIKVTAIMDAKIINILAALNVAQLPENGVGHCSALQIVCPEDVEQYCHKPCV